MRIIEGLESKARGCKFGHAAKLTSGKHSGL
jgi:hypothetical protein